MKTIKIAPSIDEVNYDKETNALITEFNGLKISYRLLWDFSAEQVEQLKGALCEGIALSSRPHQLINLMNNVYRGEGGEQIGELSIA